MSAYVSSLKKVVAEEQAKLNELKRAEAHVTRDRLTPLEDRLSRLLSTIPEEIQRKGLSLSTLQVALRGRWRGRCHPGELGAALRKLGFHRVRRWSGDAEFSTVWRRD